MSLLCPPLGFIVGVAVAAVDVAHAHQRERLYSSMLDPELVLTRTEVEVELFAAYLGLALSLIPEAGTIGGAAVRGGRVALRFGVRAGLRAAGVRGAPGHPPDRRGRVRDLLQGFLTEILLNEVLERVVQKLMEPVLAYVEREAMLSGAVGGRRAPGSSSWCSTPHPVAPPPARASRWCGRDRAAPVPRRPVPGRRRRARRRRRQPAAAAVHRTVAAHSEAGEVRSRRLLEHLIRRVVDDVGDLHLGNALNRLERIAVLRDNIAAILDHVLEGGTLPRGAGGHPRRVLRPAQHRDARTEPTRDGIVGTRRCGWPTTPPRTPTRCCASSTPPAAARPAGTSNPQPWSVTRTGACRRTGRPRCAGPPSWNRQRSGARWPPRARVASGPPSPTWRPASVAGSPRRAGATAHRRRRPRSCPIPRPTDERRPTRRRPRPDRRPGPAGGGGRRRRLAHPAARRAQPEALATLWRRFRDREVAPTTGPASVPTCATTWSPTGGACSVSTARRSR
ncbi:hypothetical protein NKG94_11090 [Micromonospora sp. M12]